MSAMHGIKTPRRDPKFNFTGPLLTLRSNNPTGVPGIGVAEVAIRGRKHIHFTAHCGHRTKKFNITRLGRAEALRRALKVRTEYERSAA